MASTWSHDAAALARLHAAIAALPRNALKTIYAEWMSHEQYPHKATPGAFYTERRKARGLLRADLVSAIYERAVRQHKQALNGVWICPHGCHAVSV